MERRASLAQRAIETALGFAAALGLFGCCGPLPPAQPFLGSIPSNGAAPFVLVGDLQTTSMLEFWREDNDVERVRVVEAIAASRPAFLVILGDLVSNGSSASAWADFDVLSAPLREAQIPVLAVAGNHEYWPFGGSLEHYYKRFPHLEKESYSTVRYGSLGLVLLNSNKDRFPAWDAQTAWFCGELRRLDEDPSVRGVLVLTHHPPYTNSTVTGDEEHIQQALVPAFKAAKKTLAMITGHVHSYERFVYGGKTFVVSGGGGGPRAELLTGERRRHPEDLFRGPAIRAFHFLSVVPSPTGLTVNVIGLSDDARAFSVIDSFTLPFSI